MAPILVVIADAQIRELVGWIIADMNLDAILTGTWREALTVTTGVPACILADLDDIGIKTDGLAALRRNWNGAVPFIILSRRPTVVEEAAAMGALAGIRKPIDVGVLADAIRRAVEGEPLK